MKKEEGKSRNKNQKSYKLRSSFILSKNRQEQKPRKFKTQKHLVKSNDVARRPLNKRPKKVNDFCSFSILATSTLMEAQEFGEMMEHVDEVNFAMALGNPSPYRLKGLGCCPCCPFVPLYNKDASCRLKGMFISRFSVMGFL